MAATFEFQEDNGTATGTPAKGTTRTTAVSQMNWKAVDDVATAYTSSPVTAGNNSMTKYQCGRLTGSFNQISSGLYAHTAGTPPTGVTIKGTVTSTYATPSTATNAALTTTMTSPIAITSGLPVSFHTTGPEGASPTTTLSAAGYTQYLATQVQTTTGEPAGDIGAMTFTLRYNEN
jgi:hypothetical protein